MKLTEKVKVHNKHGLHARPATTIVKMLQSCKSDVRFIYHREEVDAKSIMGILMLAVEQNCNVTITVDGEDAKETMKSLVTAFEDNFGE